MQMQSRHIDKQKLKAVLCKVAVIALAVWSIGPVVLDMARVVDLWNGGVRGYVANDDGYIIGPTTGLAKTAGLSEGYRIDVRHTDPAARYFAIEDGTSVMAGETKTFVAISPDHQTLWFSLTADPEDSAKHLWDFLRILASVAAVWLGAAVVLKKPNIMTWGLFLYCVNLGTFGPTSIFNQLPYCVVISYGVLWDIVNAASIVGLLAVSLRFPNNVLTRWKTHAHWALAAIFVFFAVTNVYVRLGTEALGYTTLPLRHFMNLASYAIVALALAAFASTYYHAQLADRQKIKWVFAGFIVSTLAKVADTLVWPNLFPAYWVHAVLFSLSVVVPASLYYAIVRYRVMDVRFGLQRGAILASVFLVWIFAQVLVQLVQPQLSSLPGILSQVSGPFLSLVSTALTFPWVAQIVDSVLFPGRQEALERVRLVSDEMRRATKEKAVDLLIAEKASEALNLASGAIFRKRADQDFYRTSSIGWATCAESIGKTDPLIGRLRGSAGPVDIEGGDSNLGFPCDAKAPSYAIPLYKETEMIAFILYGEHKNWTTLDPDEKKALRTLAWSGSVALALL